MSFTDVDGFTPQQKIFIAWYTRLKCNGTKAYQKAYGENMSDDQAAANSSRLISNDKIKAAIDKKLQDIADIAELDAAWVLKNLKSVAERCQQAEPVMEFDREEKRMVPTGEYKFDSAGANKSIELIGKSMAMFTDKVIKTETLQGMTENEVDQRIKALESEIGKVGIAGREGPAQEAE